MSDVQVVHPVVNNLPGGLFIVANHKPEYLQRCRKFTF
jgi:hypothetical protein